MNYLINILKVFFYFKNFKAFIVQSFFSIKVIKIQALSFFANNFYCNFFGFDKYLFFFKYNLNIIIIIDYL